MNDPPFGKNCIDKNGDQAPPRQARFALDHQRGVLCKAPSDAGIAISAPIERLTSCYQTNTVHVLSCSDRNRKCDYPAVGFNRSASPIRQAA